MSVKRTPRRVRVVATAILIGVMMSATSAAAQLGASAAATSRDGLLDGLEFSRDGISWSHEPPSVLFDRGVIDTPGESRSASLLVRNGLGVPVHIATALTQLAWSHPQAGTAFRLSSNDQWGSGISDAPIASIVRCGPLLPTRLLAADDTLAIEVKVRLDDSARGTPAETASIGFDVLIALAEYPGPAPASACSGSARQHPGLPPYAAGRTIAIASVPSDMLPGTRPEPSSRGALVAPSLAVAFGVGTSGIAILVAGRLRRDVEGVEGVDDEETA